MSVSELIMELEMLIEKMEYVSNYPTPPYYVLARHVNIFVDYCEKALTTLEALYEKYVSQTGRRIEKVEEMIKMASARLTLARRVKYGDVAYSSDHNVIIDVLKPIDVALRELEKALGI